MELYWLLRLPHLHTLFIFIGILFVCMGISIFFMSTIDNEDTPTKIYDCILYAFLISFISFLISIFIPDKSDLALMMGWDAINSNSVQEVIEILKEKIK